MSNIAIKIITERVPDVTYAPARGHGNNATETTVEGGAVRKIVIARDGEAQFGLAIWDNGEVSFTDYAPSSFVLNPRRPRVK